MPGTTIFAEDAYHDLMKTRHSLQRPLNMLLGGGISAYTDPYHAEFHMDWCWHNLVDC